MWSPDEDRQLAEAVAAHGKRWNLVSHRMGRTFNSVRNRYNRLPKADEGGVGKACRRCSKCGQLRRGHACPVAPRALCSVSWKATDAMLCRVRCFAEARAAPADGARPAIGASASVALTVACAAAASTARKASLAPRADERVVDLAATLEMELDIAFAVPERFVELDDATLCAFWGSSDARSRTDEDLRGGDQC